MALKILLITFIISSVIGLLGLLFMFLFKNELPESLTYSGNVIALNSGYPMIFSSHTPRFTSTNPITLFIHSPACIAAYTAQGGTAV